MILVHVFLLPWMELKGDENCHGLTHCFVAGRLDDGIASCTNKIDIDLDAALNITSAANPLSLTQVPGFWLVDFNSPKILIVRAYRPTESVVFDSETLSQSTSSETWQVRKVKIFGEFKLTNRKRVSENPLYYLYTSGSTGKPKGLIHTTGGYSTHAATVHKHSFGVKDWDLHGCVAVIGWTVGHSVAHYGSDSKSKAKICTDRMFRK